MTTIIIGSITIGAMIYVAYRLIKTRQKGGCGCSCDHCPQVKKCKTKE